MMRESLILLLFLFFTLPCLSEEIRIADESGLTRAVKRNISSGDIYLYLKQARIYKDRLQLKNVDGLLAAQEPDEISDELLLFREVPAGSWRVSRDGSSPSKINLYRVVIE